MCTHRYIAMPTHHYIKSRFWGPLVTSMWEIPRCDVKSTGWPTASRAAAVHAGVSVKGRKIFLERNSRTLPKLFILNDALKLKWINGVSSHAKQNELCSFNSIVFKLFSIGIVMWPWSVTLTCYLDVLPWSATLKCHLEVWPWKCHLEMLPWSGTKVKT